jgi:hypothetical protein
MSIELYCKVVVDNIVDKSSGLPNIVISWKHVNHF